MRKIFCEHHAQTFEAFNRKNSKVLKKRGGKSKWLALVEVASLKFNELNLIERPILCSQSLVEASKKDLMF